MAESCTITFGSEQYYLRLNLLSRPYVKSEHPWDQNAIETLVTARTGVFQAKISTVIWPPELERLRTILIEKKERASQAAEVVFELRDSGLEIRFTPERNNGIDLYVTIREDLAGFDDARLAFSLGITQSYIPDLIKQSDEALLWFPAI
jgi:hypothetical protein